MIRFALRFFYAVVLSGMSLMSGAWVNAHGWGNPSVTFGIAFGCFWATLFPLGEFAVRRVLEVEPREGEPC